MGTTLTLIGIGLMVQSVLPWSWMPLVGFIVFAIGAILLIMRS